jgi:thymidylate kinase
LEGADGSGKSTLANWLRDIHGYEIVKTGPPAPTGNLTVTYLDALHTAIRGPGRTVFDRCHLGEAVYGPILRGVDRIGIEGLAAIERVIAKHDVRLIICSPPWKTLVAGWRSKDDLLKDEATLRTVYERYQEEAARLGIVPYDWTAADATERLKEMIEEC